jgi:hypothetical protein
VPTPTHQPGYAAAVMKQQRHQRGFVRLTHRITRLENKVHQAMTVMDKYMGKLLNYRQLMNSPKYKESMEPVSSQRIRAIGKWHRRAHQKPRQHYRVHLPTQGASRLQESVMYGQFVCLVRPEKAEPNQMRFTLGGDRINYPGEVATPITEMLVAKMLFNSVISTKGARFMTMDISNFYLLTPLHCPKFIRIKLTDIPDKVIKEYKLRETATKNGSIYIRAKRGMYGLPQAGLLANP